MQYNEYYEVHWRKRATFPDGPKHPFVETGVETFDFEQEAMAEAQRMHSSGEYTNVIVFRQAIIELARFARATKSQDHCDFHDH